MSDTADARTPPQRADGSAALPRAIAAALIPLAALALQWVFWPAIRPFSWFLFYPAVFFSSWVGGLYAGLAATVLATACVWWFFIPPVFALLKEEPGSYLSAVVFLGMGVLFSLFNDRLRRANRQTARALEAARRANEELQAANAKITQLYEKTRELDELKTRFFANVSHELRTPLTLILGPVAKRLAAPDLGGEERRDLETVNRNARLLLRHVTDLLDVARLEAGRMLMHYSAVDLAALVRLMASHFETLASDRRIRYRVDTPERLPAEADADKCRRIVLNLLSNAFKFTPPDGTVAISLREEDGQALIRVEDSGPGVPAALRQAIFEPFRQADGGLEREHGGTGLGLAIVQEFAALHEGTVEVADAPAGGALFSVRLPLRAPAGTKLEAPPPAFGEPLEAEPAEELRALEPRAAPESAAAPDAPLVLVVEDNPDMNRFITEVLGRHYRIASARDGEEGLGKALALHPDLVVTDIMMPRMSGDRMVRALRSHLEMKEVPMLLLTAKADDALRVDMLKEGVQDYVTKPFSAEELLARVGARISAHRRQEAALKALQSEMEELLQLHVASQTAAAIAHELNQPLNALAAYTEAALRLLRAGNPTPDRLRHALEAGAEQAQRAGQVVRELLEFFHRGETITEAVDLNDAVRRALAIVEGNGHGGFRSVVELAPELRPVQANRLQVEKVLVNLLRNSVDAMRAAGVGTREVTIMVRTAGDGDMAQVTVQDTGPGLPEETLDRIFKPFYTTKPKGIGMGLAISRTLIEAHGGRLWAEPVPGAGATFHFTLPYAP